MPMAAPIVGALASTVLSKAMSGGSSGGSSSQSSEPWSEAQPLLKNILKDTGDLRSYYQQNPFNPMQQTAYQNQFSAVDNLNNLIGPGLLKGFQGLLGPGFGDISSGGLLGSAAQRQAPATPARSQDELRGAGAWINENLGNQDLVRQEAKRLGWSNADVLNAARTVQPDMQLANVDAYMGRQDPQYASPTFGILDWIGLNPYRNGSLQSAAAAQAALANETPEQRRLREDEEYLRNSGMYYQGSGAAGTGAGGGGAPSGAPGTGGSPGDSSGW